MVSLNENEKLFLHGLELCMLVQGVPGVDGKVTVQVHNVRLTKTN